MLSHQTRATVLCIYEISLHAISRRLSLVRLECDLYVGLELFQRCCLGCTFGVTVTPACRAWRRPCVFVARRAFNLTHFQSPSFHNRVYLYDTCMLVVVSQVASGKVMGIGSDRLINNPLA